MRLPRPRLSVRRIMILTAIVALACGVEIARRRYESLKKRAFEHENQFVNKTKYANKLRAAFQEKRKAIWEFERHRSRDFADRLGEIAKAGRVDWELEKQNLSQAALDQDETREKHEKALSELEGLWESYVREACYHDRMREKYEHAARYPWITIAPEPIFP